MAALGLGLGLLLEKPAAAATLPASTTSQDFGTGAAAADSGDGEVGAAEGGGNQSAPGGASPAPAHQMPRMHAAGAAKSPSPAGTLGMVPTPDLHQAHSAALSPPLTPPPPPSASQEIPAADGKTRADWQYQEALAQTGLTQAIWSQPGFSQQGLSQAERPLAGLTELGLSQPGLSPTIPSQPGLIHTEPAPERAVEPLDSGHRRGASAEPAMANSSEPPSGDGAPWLEREGKAPAPEGPPSFLIELHTTGGVVSRSVNGLSSSIRSGNQVALENGSLDLLRAPATELRIESSRIERSLAASLQDRAVLATSLSNRGVFNSAIRGGDSGGSYLISAKDQLALGLQAASGGDLRVVDRVTALENSRLEDSGGGDGLTIEAHLKLQLSTQLAELRPTGVGELASTAVRNSSIRLGDGSNRILISSQLSPEIELSPSQGQAPIATSFSPPPESTLPSLQLKGSSIGLSHSLLDSGAGDDAIIIKSTIGSASQAHSHNLAAMGNRDTSISGAELSAVAIEHSELRLGAGNDALELEGSMLNSRIEAGPGQNTISIRGPIVAGELVLSAGSQNQVVLGDDNSSLHVQGAGDLLLESGAGDNQFLLQGPFTGSINAGAGADLLLTRPRAAAGAADAQTWSSDVRLNGPDSGQLGELRFTDVESLVLGSAKTSVMVAPQGSLSGALRGSGQDDLNYGDWIQPVRVDLRGGRATAIAAGKDGGVAGFGSVRGGHGDDDLVAASSTSWLEGGDGQDWLELSSWDMNPAAAAPSQPTVLWGGGGNDLFVLPELESLLSRGQNPSGRGAPLQREGLLNGANAEAPFPSLAVESAQRPSLADLTFVTAPGGGIGLSDRLAYWLPSPPIGPSWANQGGAKVGYALVEITPCGIEGVGNIRLLPIAPLEQLLAGIGVSTAQLAIATGSNGSDLVLLEPGRTYRELATLPALHGPGGESAAIADRLQPPGPG